MMCWMPSMRMPSGTVAGVGALALTVSNPPTQAQVQAIANKIDEMLVQLKRLV
jgi:hypothetical protein